MNGRTWCYQGVTFPESPDHAYLRTKDIVETASARIKSFHAIPVFVTYAPGSLSVWNHTRLLQHKTNQLNHFNPAMQEKPITTADRINNKIFAINSKESVITPNLAEFIMYKRQSLRVHCVNRTQQTLAKFAFILSCIPNLPIFFCHLGCGLVRLLRVRGGCPM